DARLSRSALRFLRHGDHDHREHDHDKRRHMSHRFHPLISPHYSNETHREQELVMLLAEFSMWPMDKGESVGPYVARLLDIIDRSGLPYRLGPLGTCVEGDYDAGMSVIRECHE